MSSTMKDVPSTEQMLSDDGLLDEKAAGAALDKVLNKVAKDKTKPKADDSEPVLDEEVNSSDDAAAEEDSGDEDWVSSDDIAELIESLGYSDEDMSEFSGPDEFQRHVRLLDRELKKSRPGDEQELALTADEIARQKRERSDQLERNRGDDGKFVKQPNELPKLDPDEFDERLIEAMEARDAKIAELEERLNGTSQNAILSDFDNIVDGLGYEELLGNSETPTKESQKARERLFEEYKQMFNYLESQGRPVSGKKANRAIVLRALNLEFADELKKITRQQLVSKVKKQSARKTGSSRRQANNAYDGPAERDPVLIAAYKAMEAENG